MSALPSATPGGGGVTMLPPKLPDLGPTFGVVYIALIVSAMLYGVTCLQTFIYFMNVKSDPKWIKILVFGTLALDTLHEALLMHAGYYYYVKNFFNPVALMSGEWSLISHMVIEGAAAFVVQSFMVWRLHILCKRNYFLTIPAIILVLVHLGAHWAWPIQAFTGPNLSFDRIKDLTATAVVRCVVGSFTDMYIAGTLSFFLYRGRTGFKKSNDMITKIIQYIITTGLLTTVDDFLTLGVYVGRPTQFYYMFFSFLLPKLYINSLLATLNSRQAFRIGTDVVSMTDVKAASRLTTTQGLDSGMEVHVATMKFTDSLNESDPNVAHYRKPSSLGPY